MINATADELRPYIGKWVAVKDGRVVASGETISMVVRFLIGNSLVNDALFRVPLNPEVDEHIEL